MSKATATTGRSSTVKTFRLDTAVELRLIAVCEALGLAQGTIIHQGVVRILPEYERSVRQMRKREKELAAEEAAA